MTTDPAESSPADGPEFAGPVPPHDLHAEQSVLGSAMLSKTALADMAGVVRGADFYRPAHELIWVAIEALDEAGEPVDALTVMNRLRAGGVLARAGGPAYLHTLVQSVPTASNAAHYARIVRERATLRRLVGAGTRVTQLGYGAADGKGGGDVAEAVAAAHREMAAVEIPGSQAGQMLGVLAADFMEHVEAGDDALDLIPWPYEDDLPPMAAGRFTVIAGRPGMGKSVAATDAAVHCAIRLKRPAIAFTLEMSAAEWTGRAVAAEAGIPLARLTRDQMRSQDWERWSAAAGRILDAPLWVDDFPGADLAYIRSCARRFKREHGDLGLLVIDYVQLMGSSSRTESRQLEVSEISRSLKLLGKELGCAVLAVCQLNRGPEGRHDKKPAMSDLRESGSLENDADQVILVFREDYYEPESPRAGEVDLIFAKNRFGPQRTVTLAHQLDRARFVPMARQPYRGSDALR